MDLVNLLPSAKRPLCASLRVKGDAADENCVGAPAGICGKVDGELLTRYSEERLAVRRRLYRDT